MRSVADRARAARRGLGVVSKVVRICRDGIGNRAKGLSTAPLGYISVVLKREGY